jgi:SAM-dependent methyltransferase
MAHSVLEHVSDPALILAEAYRALAPNGMLVLSVPFFFPVHGDPDDFRRWTQQGLAAEAERAGFVVCEAAPVGTALDSLALNLNFLIRHHIPASSTVAWRLVFILFPFVFLGQALVNMTALIVGCLDRSNAAPIAVAISARKGPAFNPQQGVHG